jgi:hypothetical protein
MTKGKIIETLLKTTIIGLLAGIVAGFWVFFAIQSDAKAHALTVHPMSRASYLCAAGNAAVLLGVLSVPVLTFFGLCLGAIFLSLRRAVERRPLP